MKIYTQLSSYYIPKFASDLLVSLREKDVFTYIHSLRSRKFALVLGVSMGLTEHELKELSIASLLHDIGKLKIDVFILFKKGKLTKDEWRVMKAHPLFGVEVMLRYQELTVYIPFIMYHHERWDGNGYYGLKEREIPLFARIITIADAFSAMTEARPYKQALSYDTAISEIKNNAGTQFDPELADIFVKKIRDYLP
ncbi:MAG: HD-GYP domain-containing protein [Brevinematia bacterium]